MSLRPLRPARRVAAAAAAAALCVLARGHALAEPAVWRVVGPGAVVTLVGSTPTAPADGRWRTPALTRAAADARQVWFLAPLGLPGPFTAIRLLAMMEAHGKLPDGQRLSDLLSPESRARFARLAERDHIPLERLERMSPWNAQVTLGIAERRREGTLKGAPVERFILSVAQHADRRSFDRLDEDLRLLIALPRPEQVYNLEEAMRRYEDPALNARYGEAWAAGDEAFIYRDRDLPLKENAPQTWRTLQVEPRRRWADQIAELARGREDAVVVLEAQNFAGPEGLPALLRARGLKVEGPP